MLLKFSKNSIIIILLLAVIFGLAGGLAAGLFVVSNFNSQGLPTNDYMNFLNNLNYSILPSSRSSKMVIEQDKVVVKTIANSQNVLFGIYQKIKSENNNDPEQSRFDFGSYYQIEDSVGQGLIITSDGWAITSFWPESLNKIKKTSVESGKIVLSAWENYVVITRDKKIYQIDRVARDSLTGFAYLHLADANNLPVKELSSIKEIKPGQLALLLEWSGRNNIMHINSVKGNNSVYSADRYIGLLEVNQAISKNLKGSVLFGLNGSVYGLVDEEGRIVPIALFSGALKSLLKEGVIRRANLGINCVDLSKIVFQDSGMEKLLFPKYGALIAKNKQGVAVEKNSPAYLSGLKEGDIITEINNLEISAGNSLADLIKSFSAGDMVNLFYWRNGQKNNISVKLGELK